MARTALEQPSDSLSDSPSLTYTTAKYPLDPTVTQIKLAAFDILCPLIWVREHFSERLGRMGIEVTPSSPNKLLLDIPTGYALQAMHHFKRGAQLSQYLVIVTENLCPEYLEDLWDLGPTSLIASSLLPAHISEDRPAEFWKYLASHTSFRLTPGTPTRLTPRQRSVLRLIATGHRNRQIAELLHIELQSVKNTIGHIYARLGCDTQAQAILYYWGLSSCWLMCWQ